MDSIDYRVLEEAAKYIGYCEPYAEIHTVTITLNGQHGGADVLIEGLRPVSDNPFGEEYQRTFQIS